MGIGYQIDDREAYDYDLWFIDPSIPGLRGPRFHSKAGTKLCFSGAAQTFGRFTSQPYPLLISKWTNVESLNLGFSGAGPSFFIDRPILLDLISRSDYHFMQVTSARSISAGMLKVNRNNGVLTFTEGPLEGQTMLAAEAYKAIRDQYGESAYQHQVKLAQIAWVDKMIELSSIKPSRTYLVWISNYMPSQIPSTFGAASAVGEFPHFVNNEMVQKVAETCKCFINCTYTSSKPQLIVDKFSGSIVDAWPKEKYPKRPDKLRPFNTYYTTPEHHFYAAVQILKRCIIDDIL